MLQLILQIQYFYFRISLKGIKLHPLIMEFCSPFLSNNVVINKFSKVHGDNVSKIIKRITFSSANKLSVYGCPPFCAITLFTRKKSCWTCWTLFRSSLVLLSKTTWRFSHRIRNSYNISYFKYQYKLKFHMTQWKIKQIKIQSTW